MSNAISRRAFLKCAGASALAVGAASMLSGCDFFDKAMGSLIGQVGEASGIAMAKMGGTDTDWALVAVGAKSTWWSRTVTQGDDKPSYTYLDIVGIGVEVKNYQNKDITLSAADITDVKVDGHNATVLTNTDVSMKDYKNYGNYVAQSLFRTGDSKKCPADKNMNGTAIDGYVFFALNYANEEEKLAAQADWSKVRFTLKLNGDTKTFEVYKTNGNVTSKVV